MKFYPLKKLANPSKKQLKSELASEIFHQIVKLEGIKKEFSKILLYPQQQRRDWVEENADLVTQVLGNIKQESKQIFTDVSALQEMHQITEYFVIVQQTLEVLDRITEESDLSHSIN